jgi:tetratricopeptide (TPR) repeat protein
MNANDLIEKANQATEQENWHAAYQYWSDVQAIDPDNEWVALKIGHTLLELERYEEAEDVLLEDIQIYPNRPFAYLDLARIAEHQERWDTAIKHWDTIIQRFNNYEWTQYFYAHFLKKLGNRDQAERYFLMDVIKHPHHIYSYLELIQIALDKLQLRLAHARIEDFCEKHPEAEDLVKHHRQQLQRLKQQIHVRSYFDLEPNNANLKKIQYPITVIPKFKCMYIAVPKIATSSVLRNLYRITHNDDQYLTEELRDAMKGIIIPDAEFTGQYWDAVKTAINDKDYFVFTFVRNPYSRILSGYLEKFLRPHKDWTMYRTQLGFDPDIKKHPVSFVEFLRRVREYHPSKLNSHFAQQRYILGLDRSMRYDFIGRLEDMSSDLPYVLSRLDQNQAVDVLHQAPHARNASEKLQQYYGEEEKALVAEIYADDFKYLGYGLDWNLI